MSLWSYAGLDHGAWISTACLGQVAQGEASDQIGPEAIGAVALFALLGIAMIMILFVGAYVLRWTMRRAGGASEPRSATIAEDAWLQHKVPDVDVLGDVEDWDVESEDE